MCFSLFGRNNVYFHYLISCISVEVVGRKENQSWISAQPRTVKCSDRNMPEYNLAFLLPKLCRELLGRGAGVDGVSRGGKWKGKQQKIEEEI